MSKNSTTIINEIKAHIKNSSAKSFSEFYVGITGSTERRVFQEHNVPKEGHCFITRKATNIDEARKAESFLLKLGMKGGTGGGDDDSIIVYCYKIGLHTRE